MKAKLNNLAVVFGVICIILIAVSKSLSFLDDELRTGLLLLGIVAIFVGFFKLIK